MKKYIKHLLVVLAVILFTGSTKAQVSFSGGIMGGVSMGAVKISDLGQAFSDAIEGNNIYGFEAGVYAKLLLNPFYIKPALLYDYRSGDVTYRESSSGTDQTSNFTIHKLQVPLLLGFHILGPLNIEAGPVYNYVLSVTDQYQSSSVDVGKNGLGWRAGAMVELGGLTLGLSYQGAAYTSGSGNATLHEPYKIVLGLGIRLGTTGKG